MIFKLFMQYSDKISIDDLFAVYLRANQNKYI